MAITSLGLGSGIDVKTIVEGLVKAEGEVPNLLLDRKKETLDAKISSFGIFKSALSDFNGSLSGLKLSTAFNSLAATSSDETVVKAKIASNAEAGSYAIEVKQLAQAHTLASSGFSDVNTAVGTGTLTFKFGTTVYDEGTDSYTSFTQNADKATFSLTLDSTNNSLVGIRDAINEAKAGVTATIINDGTSNRLVFTSTDSGQASSMQITSSDASLSAFEFNATSTAMSQTIAAQDAKISLNGLDITNPSNSFDKVLKGVTIDVQKTNVGSTVKLDIGSDAAAVVKSLEDFVGTYNELIKTVDTLVGYDVATGTGGVLLGDATVRTAMSQVRSVLGGIVSGLEGTSIRTLSDIGLSTQVDGSLVFTSKKLTDAMASDPDGVAAVFSVIGRPDNSGVTYFSSTSDTETGNYDVEITQAATQGVLNNLAITASPLIVTTGVNDTFSISVDGTSSGSITLSAGTYTSSELAAEMQSKINGDSSLKNAGAKLDVTFDSSNNRFVMTSSAFGASSKVNILQSTATDFGIDSSTAGVDGTDVAGTIGGVTATGNGQFLTAPNGLQLLIGSGLSGNLGSVNFSRGLMEKLSSVLDGMLKSKGTLDSKTDGLEKSLESIDEEKTQLNERVAKFEQRLLKRFNAMDALVGQLQGTGSFLSSQLESLPYNNIKR